MMMIMTSSLWGHMAGRGGRHCLSKMLSQSEKDCVGEESGKGREILLVGLATEVFMFSVSYGQVIEVSFE